MRIQNGVKVECVVGTISIQRGIEAVVTPAFDLATQLKPGEATLIKSEADEHPHVAFCQGPESDDWSASTEIFEACYRNSLLEADLHEISSIAFPAIFVGRLPCFFFEATDIACGVILKTLASFISERSVKIASTR